MEHTLLYSEFERSRLEVIYKLVILSIMFWLFYQSSCRPGPGFPVKADSEGPDVRPHL